MTTQVQLEGQITCFTGQ